MNRAAARARLTDLKTLRARIEGEIHRLDGELTRGRPGGIAPERIRYQVPKAARVGFITLDAPTLADAAGDLTSLEAVTAAATLPTCGTDTGYHHHRRVQKAEACAACKQAHNEYEADRARRQKERAA